MKISNFFTRTINEADKRYTIDYYPNQQRAMTTYTVNNTEQEKKIYCGREYEHNLTTNTQYNYIYAGNMPVALYVQGDTNAMYTLHTNYIGSIEKISDTYGNVVDSMSYTPFGQRKLYSDWSKTDTAKHLIDRGFTGQQHLDNFALINFNGRMYDPVLAHFLSPDPYIQNPENPLNYNRYAYCLYSPLQYVDPSGEMITASIDDYFIYANGTIEVLKTNDDFDRFYIAVNINGQTFNTLVGQFDKNEKGLIQLPSSFSFTNYDFGTRFGFQIKKGNEDKAYIRGDAFAALIGALALTNTLDLTIIGFSKSDGSSPPPSVSHKNGINGDLRYFQKDFSSKPTLLGSKDFDMNRQNKFNDALYDFGWTNMLSERFTPYGELNTTILNHTSHYNKTRHHNHLHLQGFKPNLIIK